MKNIIFVIFTFISLLAYAGTAKTVQIQAGGLSASLSSADLSSVSDLTITGSMDARDFKTIRDNMTVLSVLNISGATITSYSGTSGTAGTNSLSYAANTIPAYAFYHLDTQKGNTTLNTIQFPSGLVSIGDYAFRECTDLSTCLIPSSVTNIGGAAFRGCIKLGTVFIPQSVNIVGDYAFSACSGFFMVDQNNPDYSSLDGILFNKNQTRLIQCPVSKTGKLSIPSSVTTIGNGAFQDCSGLAGDLLIPASVSTVGYYAFEGCSGFTGLLNIPSSVLSIGASAFAGCTGLTFMIAPSLHIADETSFPSAQFTKLTLTGTIDARDFKVIRDKMSVLGEIDLNNARIAAYTGTLGTLGSSSTTYAANTIPANAFYYAGTQTGKTTLTSILLPTGITSVGNYAFKGCIGLTTLSIPQTVSTIGVSAFEACNSILSILAPSLHIADETSFPNAQITKLTLNGQIDARDFRIIRDNMPVLAEIDLNAATVAAYTGTSGTAGTSSVSYAANTIPAYAFYNAGTQSGKTTLTSINLPAGIISFGDYAFEGCSGLTTMFIPVSVTTIGINAFSGCRSMGTVEIPKSVTAIGQNAFSGNKGLITVDTDNAQFASLDGILYNKNFTRLIQCPVTKTGTLQIPSTVTTIVSGAFKDCVGFTGTLTIPSSVTSIGASAFDGCTGLTSLIAPSLHMADATSFQNTQISKLTLTSLIDARDFKTMRDQMPLSEINLSGSVIGAYTGDLGTAAPGSVSYPANTIPEFAFYNPGTQKVNNTLTTIQLPSGLVSIGNYAFYGSGKVDMINISKTVNLIGDYAFTGCSGLFNVDSDNAVYASLNDMLFNKNLTTLIQSPVSKTGSLLIPSFVTTIGNAAFQNCSGFTGPLTIPSTVSSIGVLAFDGCTGLESMSVSSLHIADVSSFANTSITKLTLTGTIDARDFKVMRDDMLVLADVDLTGTTISSYTGTLGTAGTNSISYPANTIPVYAFNHLETQMGKVTLSSIQFPAGLSSMGAYAFRGCSGLTALSIPLSVTTIEGGVFQGCTGLTGALMIPSSIVSVGSQAFQGCTGYTESLIIPSSVTAIGTFAFAGCTGIKSLTAPSLHIADASSFQNTSITKLTLTSPIDARDFKFMRDNFSRLTDANLSETTVNAYTGTLGTLGTNSVSYPANAIPANALYHSDSQTGMTSLSVIDFPANIVSVGDNAFRRCTGLTAVVLPSTVATIGSGAFQGCTGLMSVPFTTAITSVGSSAFQGCTALTGLLEIPSSISIVEPEVFAGCTGLTSLNIPLSVASVGVSAFAGCTGVTTLTAPSLHMADETSFPNGQIKKLTLISTIDARDFRAMRDYLSILGTVNLSDAAISSYTGIFGTASTDIASYSANTIPAYAFCNPMTQKGKSTLTTILFPASLVSVENNAFMGCTGLTTVSIPSLVTKIGGYAFSGCNKVDSARIPGSVTVIDDYAFSRCSGYFMVDANNPQYSALDGVLYNKVLNRLIQCPVSKTGNYTIPTSVTVIGCGAFLDCTGLVDSLLIPTSVTTIETLAFSGCTGFNGLLTIPSSVTSVGAYAFASCSALTSLNAQSLHIADVTAFENTPISKLSLTGTINAYDFKLMRDHLPVLADIDLAASTIAAYAGKLGTAGTDSISYSANTIPADAFYDIYSQLGKVSLTSFKFPVGLSAVGENAFWGCTGLTDLSFPLSVTSIGHSAFLGCTGLRGLLTIPFSVTSVGISAFSGCTGLTSLTAPALHIADITSFPWSQFTKLTLHGIIDARDFKVMRDNMSVLRDVDLSTGTVSAYTGIQGTQGAGNISYPENTIPAYAFYHPDTQNGKTTLTTMKLPSYLASIGECAFRNCSGFTSIYIPDSVTSIGNYAFLQFSGPILVDVNNEAYASFNGALFNKVLTKVIQCPTMISGLFSNPYTLTTVGNAAFYGCSNLTSVKMPASVHIIGDSAFRECSGLESLYAYKTIPVDLSSSVDVFKGINLNTCKLYVPDSSLTLYEDAPKWKDFLNITNIERIQLDTLGTLEAGCDGHNQDLYYRILSGEPNQYQVTFDSTALSVGFRNLIYTDLPTTDSMAILPFEIPLGTPDGTYVANLRMRDVYGFESLPYTFSFTVNLSPDSIIAKFDDVVLCDNGSNRFVGYQWYKNGELISGATRQYYSDPEGLVGFYSVRVRTMDGEEIISCPKELNIPLLSEKSVIISPNPVKKGQSCTMMIKGLSEAELQGATLNIFDMNGVSVYSVGDLTQLHTLTLSMNAGVYVGNVTTAGGEKITFQFVVIE